MSKLTAKQEKFCLEYMVDLNATQAAIRAGYSEKGARVEGVRMLTKASIQEKIHQLKKEEQQLRDNLQKSKIVNEVEARELLSYTARGVRLIKDEEVPFGVDPKLQLTAQKTLADLHQKDRALNARFELRQHEMALQSMRELVDFLFNNIPNEVKKRIFNHPRASEFFDLQEGSQVDPNQTLYLNAS